MDNKEKNLVQIKDWKSEKTEASFSRYLKVLNFNDLMNESRDLLEQLRINNKDDDLFSKTKSLIHELSSRLEKESKFLAQAAKDLKKQIEEKM